MKQIAENVFCAEGSRLIGDVKIGEHSSVWYNAVIRGDVNRIEIGEYTNIQDNAVLHVRNSDPLIIGDCVTIGHGAILHGCTIRNNVTIGMGAIVLDGAVIEENCIIGAGTIVTQNKVIESGYLAIGSPARMVREVTEEEKESIRRNAYKYAEEAAELLVVEREDV